MSTCKSNIHVHIGHAGVMRMFNFVRSKSYSHSLKDVRTMILFESICAEINPQFYQKTPSTLIHGTGPCERLSLNFKDPIPSVTKQK